MVTQKSVRTCGVKLVIQDVADKNLKYIFLKDFLHTCTMCSELPSNIRTMINSKLQGKRQTNRSSHFLKGKTYENLSNKITLYSKTKNINIKKRRMKNEKNFKYLFCLEKEFVILDMFDVL